MVIVSPYAKPVSTDSNVASFASLLAFTEHTFGLAPLSTRDADAYWYDKSFDYGQAPIPRVRLHLHRVPPAELRWIETHPPDPDDPT